MPEGLLKKLIYIIAGMLALVLGWFCAQLIFGTSEDYWLCRSGEWVKQGEPTEPQPTTPCPEIK